MQKNLATKERKSIIELQKPTKKILGSYFSAVVSVFKFKFMTSMNSLNFTGMHKNSP